MCILFKMNHINDNIIIIYAKNLCKKKNIINLIFSIIGLALIYFVLSTL